ncbi:MAG TPA: Spy/CpxP family protein refolding chaperone [Bryobacteraceae bacterium]|jgi:Spy/CpxP family protein refolding chaperone
MFQTFAVVAFMVVGLANALVFAPDPQGPPDPQNMIARRVNLLASELGLTDAQKTAATTIYTNAATAGQPIRSSLEDNRKSMIAAVRANDTAAIDALSQTAGTLSGQLTAIDRKAEAAFYALLTPDQQTKFASLRVRQGSPPARPAFR